MENTTSIETQSTGKLIGIINNVSIRLLDVKEEREIYHILADAIKEILPGSFFAVTKLQPDDMNFRIIESSGFEKYKKGISVLIGKDPFSMDFPFNDLPEDQLKAFESRKFTHFPDGIRAITKGKLSKYLCKTLEKILCIADVCAISLTVDQKYFGGITFFIPTTLKKSGLMNVEAELAIEAISNQASTVIRKIRNEEALRKHEEKLKEQADQLLELNNGKDKFFSIIAHDLKSPFNVILGYSKLLFENAEKYENEETRLYAKNISIFAGNTYLLLENILDWTRLQRGQLIAHLQIYELHNIVDMVCLTQAEVAKSKNIILQNRVPSNLVVCCDMDMIRTVLRNLISNAIKFSNPEQTVTIDAQSTNGFIEISIKDEGVGIDNEKIPHLFMASDDISTRGTADEKGTGLGLMLAKELIERQGGTIRVESTVNKGTTFFINLLAEMP